ncbi:hypothetical protein AC244_34485 [Ensifer adhaerens]|uniref:General secretion pathway protein GspN n=1 Tax=Ensifer adhaerens TaxID=106592 RepID=A0A0L8BCW2_ENSAD|nr:hypothetical protein [Ensifer adhaerens]KOF12409.1 hypothetical protein AC244_34485 [Ensifer adhaerens]
MTALSDARLSVLIAVVLFAGPASSQSPSPDEAPWATLDKLEATRLHPLFTPTRRPPVVDEAVDTPAPVAAADVETVPDAPPQLKLVGIISTTDSRQALLQDAASGQIHRLKDGEKYRNWNLSIVDSRTVAFEQSGRRQDYKMFLPIQ